MEYILLYVLIGFVIGLLIEQGPNRDKLSIFSRVTSILLLMFLWPIVIILAIGFTIYGLYGANNKK